MGKVLTVKELDSLNKEIDELSEIIDTEDEYNYYITKRLNEIITEIEESLYTSRRSRLKLIVNN